MKGPAINGPYYRLSGFTLVEIMIVVAIIALLAAIAIPNFLRARERGQAVNVLNDARIYESAIAQWAIEQNKTGGDLVTGFADVQGYVKPNSRLYDNNGKDLFSNGYFVSTVSTGVGVNLRTIQSFEPTVVPLSFWSGYESTYSGP